MILKQYIDYPAFLKRVKLCQDEVSFQTDEGDVINLKSTLSMYIFVTIANNPALLSSGKVVCKSSADYVLLKDYLT